MSCRTSNRRDFLKASAGMAALGVAVPYFWTAAQAQEKSKNDKLGVAAIGVGGQGSRIGHEAASRGNLVACCDVDRQHAERFAAKYEGKCQIYGDYRKLLQRKDVDLVTIGTPDHWHTAIAIAAMKAGKDVYCEKPLTLTIGEGKLLCKVVKQTGRVFQVGTQQRSDQRFLTAVAIARSGRLGKTLTATCSIGAGRRGGPFANTDPPPDLDWDFWLGQAPMVPYCKERCHSNFRWWLEYSGGKLTDWGAHHVDIAQWGLGYENSGPIEIEGKGEFPDVPNGYSTAVTFHCTLSFSNGSKIILHGGPENGVWFEGDQGRIFVNRRELTGKPVEELSDQDRERLQQEILKLYKGKQRRHHMDNFFECVRDRSQPVSDVFSHHRELSSCHMCNIAMLLKRKLQWDLRKEDFIGDDQASRMLSRKQRAPYTITA